MKIRISDAHKDGDFHTARTRDSRHTCLRDFRRNAKLEFAWHRNYICTAAFGNSDANGKPNEVKAVYVIMLDRLLSKYPEQWPISGMSDNPKTLEDQKQHDGNPALVPKRLYNMTEWTSKHKITLKNVITGEADSGKIYTAGTVSL